MSVCMLMWKYRNPAPSKTEMLLAFATFASYCFMVLQLLPQEYYYMLQTINWPILVYSRGSQVLFNLKNKHTGAQSIITHTMNLGGSAIRILTTLKEIGFDYVLLSGYGLSIVLNCLLVLECLVYWNNTQLFMKKLKEQSDKKQV